MLLQMALFHSFLWLSSIVFHCIYVPYLLYPFIFRWTFRLFPCLGYCEYRCCEHWGARIFLDYSFARWFPFDGLFFCFHFYSFTRRMGLKEGWAEDGKGHVLDSIKERNQAWEKEGRVNCVTLFCTFELSGSRENGSDQINPSWEVFVLINNM